MAVLGKKEIEEAINNGTIAFSPLLDGFQLQPNAVDLRLGWGFYVPKNWNITKEGRVAVRPDHLQTGFDKENFTFIELSPGQYFEILPSEHVLVSTLEKITLNTGDIIAILHPRSSMIRRGLVIESGVVDVYYAGTMIIPIFNGTNHVIRLYPGERCYQLVFERLESAVNKNEADKHGIASAKYTGVTASNSNARRDSDEEIVFLRSGNIDGLKKQFTIQSSRVHE
ncbi:MAG: dCTP deaminase [Candidatus Ryanbacteria bacterium RIFCSPHIGHO2_02_FULL_45_13b]|uniref:dCTP deaminase n=1 Tax=Candidatus Ryanbacteria bacterium RIFCSPHIGHO2_02_FULL_45_13b TaxID=1802117 RepID=A0A1G2G8W3_9BACT|nr:MAG: dCTP deaminase [Candidatus Ryanbacteria bacterium RIFCSPHIGHO2_02_FULL_45_13b]